MENWDFEVRIRSDRQGGFETEVLNAPCSAQVSAPFVPPYAVEEIEPLLDALANRVRDGERGRDFRQRSVEGEPDLRLEKLGERLFSALMHGKVAEAFEQSLAFVEGRGKSAALRLWISFATENPALSPVAALPWELIFRPATRDFLARQRRWPVLRSVSVPRSFTPPAEGSALRVLVMRSEPKNLPGLDLAAELKAIRAILKPPGSFEIDVLDHPSLPTLRPKLRAGRYHVLHVMGHGGFEENQGEGLIYLEGQNGRADRVTGTAFAENLKDLEELRLIVLNTCSGGTLPRRLGQDAFRSVAPSLLLAGLPAVLAMQFPITDEAAIAFNEAFYAGLAAGDSVDAAAAEARLAIYNADPSSMEWATPALFLGSRDVRVLELRPAQERTAAGQEARTRPLRLGIRSFAGPDSFANEMETETDRMLPLDEHFRGRYIRDEALWQTDILPKVRDFVVAAARERGPVMINIAAHGSIAFAAGYCLGTKSSLDLTILQPGKRTAQEWKGESMPLPETPLWDETKDILGVAGAADVALAVSITQDVLSDAEVYLSRAGLTVSRILTAQPFRGPDVESVRDGAHALQLAQSLAWKIRTRTLQEREGVLHVFASAPNGLLFFLGQLCRGMGQIQLYEYDLESGVPGAYRPSIRLPGSEAGVPRAPA